MKAVVINHTKILKANPDHQNFQETDQIIPEGTVVEGKLQKVSGLRRGQPFVYRVFITNKGHILFENQVKPEMANVEVLLNADGKKETTTGNDQLKKAVLFAAGAVGCYLIAKKKGSSTQTAALVGALGGFAVVTVATSLTK